jgi:hypothetical protein
MQLLLSFQELATDTEPGVWPALSSEQQDEAKVVLARLLAKAAAVAVATRPNPKQKEKDND